jgi:membrane AbrB-like protein
MTDPHAPPTGFFSTKPRGVQWTALVVLSLVLAVAMESAGLPAAALIGPMLAAIVLGTSGAGERVPRPAFATAQAFVGCLIAASIEPEIVLAFLDDWPLFLGVAVTTVAASSVLGYLISRWRILPGTTGVWGFAPGAASAMVLMAGAFGADQRLVAFMQYLRVLMVSVAAALVAGLWVDTSGVSAPAHVWFPPIEWAPFATTLAVAATGMAAGRLLRLPSPNFLGAMIVGFAAHLGLGLPFQLPLWLLSASYVVIGWSIGLNFNREIVAHAVRALPKLVVSILVLMAFCAGLAWLLNRLLGVDPLTAYLATSPGGMDSVAIIAAASREVNISFVMALQMARFLFVLVFGPPIARLVARAIKP